MFIGVMIPMTAQEYLVHYDQYNIEDGLLHREVNAIAEDCEGLMWLATKRGINSFDGHRFKAWTHEQDSILTNHIGEVFEDAQHFIWLIPFNYSGGDITLLNHQTHEIIDLDEKYGKLLPYSVEDIRGNILITKDSNIIISYISGTQFTIITRQGEVHNLPLPFNSFQPTISTADNGFWAIADNNTLVKFNSEGKITNKYLTANIIAAKGFSADDKSVPFFHSSGGANCSLNDQGELYFLKAGSFPIPLGWSGKFRDIVSLDNNDSLYWIYNQGDSYNPNLENNDNKIYLIDQGGQIQFDLINKIPVLNKNGIRALFVDSRGKTWIGSNFGLTVLELHLNKFSIYLNNKKEDSYNRPKSCRGLLVNDSMIYANVESDALFTCNIHSKLTHNILPVNKNANRWFVGLSSDKMGRIWIGSENHITILNHENKIVKNYPLKFKETVIPWTFYFKDSGEVLIGTENGLYYYNPEKDRVEPYQKYNRFSSIKSSHINFIQKINDNHILVCSNTGLYEIDPLVGIIARYWSGAVGKQRIPNDFYQHFYCDKEGLFWLASAGGGLIKWNKEQGTYEQFGKSEGLSNDVIYAIYPDTFGHLWLSSDYGIIRFNKKTYESRAYMPSDGISHFEFNRISHFQMTNGNIYFGSLNGITEIIPENFILDSTYVRIPLIVTDFHQFNNQKKLLIDRKREIVENNEIILCPNDGFFKIEFALLNFIHMDKVNYAYKITGVNKEWQYQKENYIQLSGLPYGHHLLKIKGQMPNGQWSKAELSIPISVLLPIYRQGWFIVMVVLGFLIVGPLIYFWQIRKMKLRQMKLEKIVEERTHKIEQDKKTIEKQAVELRQLDKLKSRFFTNVTHELRTPLALMLGPIGSALQSGQLNKKNEGFLRMAKKSGLNLLSLVGEILDLSKMESGKMILNKEPVHVKSFFNRLFAQYESHARHRGINMTFIYEAKSDLQLMLDVNKFEKIYNNLLSNALKFTVKEDDIQVFMKDLGTSIRLSIYDSGPGIHEDDLPSVFDRYYQSKQPDATIQGGSGIGLALCKEYVQLFKGQIWVESELGEYTRFILDIPKIEIPSSVPIALIKIPIEKDKVQKEEFVLGINTDKLENRANILVVEDNLDLSNYLKLILSDYYRVDVAYNGREAVELLSRSASSKNRDKVNSFDLIISDVMMPVMDGFELLQHLKSHLEWQKIPVVMLTARTALEDKLTALRIGVDDYMMKPFEEEELLARVHNLLMHFLERKKLNFPIKEDSYRAQEIDDDKEWLAKLEYFTVRKVSDFNLTADVLATEMSLSRTQFFRKIKKYAGMTPTQYVKEIRFNCARTLLEKQTFSNVKAVAYEVGFKQVKHFSKEFKKRYGKSPSEYLN